MTRTDSDLVSRTTCQALVITCSDFRFKSAERRFIESAGLADDYDLIARPGGIRSLVLPRDAPARDSMTDEMGLLWSLHRFSQIIALNHLSCRAYDDLATALNECQVHAEHLRKARELLGARFKGVSVETYVLGLDGTPIAVA